MSESGADQNLSVMQIGSLCQVSNENNKPVRYMFCIDPISLWYD